MLCVPITVLFNSLSLLYLLKKSGKKEIKLAFLDKFCEYQSYSIVTENKNDIMDARVATAVQVSNGSCCTATISTVMSDCWVSFRKYTFHSFVQI